jgi:4-oxalocrotonate tautomerase
VELKRFARTSLNPMPLINVKIMEGIFSSRQKVEIAQKLTDAMVSIHGESMRPHTLLVIEEIKSGDWAAGGKCYTTADVKAVLASVEKS